jgi:anaerobic ribonucleoside-triphosphate reductase activating protein
VNYLSHDIVFKEHPKHVSIGLFITGCPNKCPGCHSPVLQTNTGKELTVDELKKILTKYNGLADNVIFFGGDHCADLNTLLIVCKEMGYKTTLWTGSNSVSGITMALLDYLKVGPYKQELGGLSSPMTNQKYFDLKNHLEIKLEGAST